MIGFAESVEKIDGTCVDLTFPNGDEHSVASEDVTGKQQDGDEAVAPLATVATVRKRGVRTRIRTIRSGRGMFQKTIEDVHPIRV